MSKPYTAEDLCQLVYQDRTWRIKELADMRTLVERADNLGRTVLLRALVGLCYAHWEGYVKRVAKLYLEHISLRKHRYEALDRQFLRNHFLPRLDALSYSKVGFEEKCQLIDKILDGFGDEFRRVNDDLIYTENLKSNVVLEICKICGLDSSYFSEQAEFIDIFLLKRRNSIAHGEDTLVGIEDMPRLIDDTMTLMRVFGDSVENAAVLKTYLKNNS